MKPSNFKISGKDPRAVSIARYPPWRGKEAYKGRRYTKLAPFKPLLDAWRDGLLTEEEYTKRFYRETLDTLDALQVYHEIVTLAGEDAILLCWEAPGEFCHRRIVSAWLKKALGIEVPEVR